jgi:hypothetical protein
MFFNFNHHDQSFPLNCPTKSKPSNIETSKTINKTNAYITQSHKDHKVKQRYFDSYEQHFGEWLEPGKTKISSCLCAFV